MQAFVVILLKVYERHIAGSYLVYLVQAGSGLCDVAGEMRAGEFSNPGHRDRLGELHRGEFGAKIRPK